MDASNKEVAGQAISDVFEEMAKTAIRFGIAEHEVSELLRCAFVRAFYSTPEFWRFDKPTAQQCAVRTGLTRVEVSRLKGVDTVSSLRRRKSPLSPRVLEGWKHDPEYQARTLPYRSAQEASFHRLCRKYANDVDPAVICDDLEAAGCIRVENACVTRTDSTYGLDVAAADKLRITAFMAERLWATGERNMLAEEPSHRRLKRYWRERLIPEEQADNLCQWITEESIETGRRIEKRMTEVAHPAPRPGVRYRDMGIGMYLFELDDASVQKTEFVENHQGEEQ